MSLQRQAQAVFREVEKLYKLMGLYSGKLRQVDKQVSLVDNVLDQNLRRDTHIGPEGLRFDLMMGAVYFGSEPVFKVQDPETTLSYALFCEGIKTLILKPELRGQELYEWTIKVAETIKSPRQEDEDLASLLWKGSRSPNIRVSLYSALAEASEFDENKRDDLMDEGEREKLFDRGPEGQRLMDSQTDAWHLRDDEWELPDGELISHHFKSLNQIDPAVAERLREELANASVSERAEKIVRFQKNELQGLRLELEKFDQNQVDFNTLVHTLHILEKSTSNELAQKLAVKIETLLVSVVERFHAGLLAFFLRTLERWEKNKIRPALVAQLRGILQKALNSEKNAALLAEAFGIPSRTSLAEELLSACSLGLYKSIFMKLSMERRSEALSRFLDALLKRQFPLEDALVSWGEDAIINALPLLVTKNWDKKAAFFNRCLRSRSRAVSELAAERVSFLRLPTEEALGIFSRLSSLAKKAWLKSLLQSAKSDNWEDFVNQAIARNIWRDGDPDLIQLWVRSALHYWGRSGMERFEPFVSARQFLFFPKFSREREAILRAAVSQKDPVLRPFVETLVQREKSVIFQSAELKKVLGRIG